MLQVGRVKPKREISLIPFDPGERRVKGQIRTEMVTAYIAEKRGLKSATSVGVMLLVAWESQWEIAQLFKFGHSP